MLGFTKLRSIPLRIVVFIIINVISQVIRQMVHLAAHRLLTQLFTMLFAGYSQVIRGYSPDYSRQFTELLQAIHRVIRSYSPSYSPSSRQVIHHYGLSPCAYVLSVHHQGHSWSRCVAARQSRRDCSRSRHVPVQSQAPSPSVIRQPRIQS